jgi:hypothetical protein
VKINKPLDAMKAGMAYLPEDRKKDGIISRTVDQGEHHPCRTGKARPVSSDETQGDG